MALPKHKLETDTAPSAAASIAGGAPLTIDYSADSGHVPLLYHMNALRAADERFQAERDRRYTVEAALRAEALNIKGTADAKALELQQANQAYKDEKANMLREQIGAERGLYPTKPEMAALADKFAEALKPLNAFVTGAQTKNSGFDKWVPVILSAMFSIVMAGIAIFAVIRTTH